MCVLVKVEGEKGCARDQGTPSENKMLRVLKKSFNETRNPSSTNILP